MSTGGEDVLKVRVELEGEEQFRRRLRRIHEAAGGGAAGRAAQIEARGQRVLDVMAAGQQIQRGGGTTGSRSLDEAIVRQATREATRHALPGVMRALLGERDIQRTKRETAQLEKQTARQAAVDRQTAANAAARATPGRVAARTVQAQAQAGALSRAAGALEREGEIQEAARLRVIGSRMRQLVSQAERAEASLDRQRSRAAVQERQGQHRAEQQLDRQRSSSLISQRVAQQRAEQSLDRQRSRASIQERTQQQRAEQSLDRQRSQAMLRQQQETQRHLDSQARRQRVIDAGQAAMAPLPGVSAGTRARRITSAVRLMEAAGADVSVTEPMRARAARLRGQQGQIDRDATFNRLERGMRASFPLAIAGLTFQFGGMPVTGLETRLAQMQRPGLSTGQLAGVSTQGLATQASMERLAAQGAPQRQFLAGAGERLAAGAERLGLGGAVPLAAAGIQGAAGFFNVASMVAMLGVLVGAVNTNTAATAANTAAITGGGVGRVAGGVGAALGGAAAFGGAVTGGVVAAVVADESIRRLGTAQQTAVRATIGGNPLGDLVNVIGQARDWFDQLTREDAAERIPPSQRARVQAATGNVEFDAFRQRQRDEQALQENAPETVAFEQEQLQRAQQMVTLRRQELAIGLEEQQQATALSRVYEDQGRQREQLATGYRRAVRDAYADERRTIDQIQIQHGRQIEQIGVQFGRSRDEAKISFAEQREDVEEQFTQARTRRGRDFEFARQELRQQTVESREDVETNARRGFRDLIIGQIGGLAGGIIGVALQKQDALRDLETRERRGLAAIGRQEARGTGAGSDLEDDRQAALRRIEREERRTLGPGGRIERAQKAAEADAGTQRDQAIADAQQATLNRINQAAQAYVDASEDLSKAQRTELERFNQDATLRAQQRQLALDEIQATRTLTADFRSTVKDHVKIYQDLAKGLEDIMDKLNIKRLPPSGKPYRPE